MSDRIGHYCGVALVRLRKPLEHFAKRYGDPAWGLRKLYLLMEKQHNRGQDGAGMAVVKLDMPPGAEFIKRIRSDKHNAIERVFDIVMGDINALSDEQLESLGDAELKRTCEFLGELYIGHLRYGTHSGNELSNCHPYLRVNNRASRNLALAGNFNMTNSVELFNQLVEVGLNPTGDSDTQVILEGIGYCLDREHDFLRATMGPGSFRGIEGRELAREISRQLDLVRILRKASEDWDGGYFFAGLLGNGDAFACRDPVGIRPGFYHVDDEVVAVASERAALANVFDISPEHIDPIEPGHALVMKRGGSIEHRPFTHSMPVHQCTFERIYFSRGNDPDIYQERKALGRNLAQRVLEAIGGDLEHTVFSYIPNTAEAAFVGLIEEIDRLNRQQRVEDLWTQIQSGQVTRPDVEKYLNGRLRAEKVAHKDQRLRTFITHDAARRDLVSHIYDITRGVVRPQDTLVVLDDSIVRGTTLRESIITMLSRLNPQRIIVVSSAPPILYPDCYGIDMSQLGRFIGFEAAVALLHDHGDAALLDEVEASCRRQSDRPPEHMSNQVRAIYEPFSLEDLSKKISQLVRPRTPDWSGEVSIIYQSVEGLRTAIPNHSGDWYFTGDYPTPGGYKVLNTSYLNWRAACDVRAY